MIVGIIDKKKKGSELKRELLQTAESMFRDRVNECSVWSDEQLALCHIPFNIDTLDENPQPFMSEDQSVVGIFDGKIYNAHEIRESLGAEHKLRTGCSGEVLLHLYDKDHENFLDSVNGKFSFAMWDRAHKKLILGRDRLGIEPMFYYSNTDRFVFGSSLRLLMSTGYIDKQLNQDAILQYLLFCYNPGDESFIKDVYKLPAGHLLTLNGNKKQTNRYWYLSFADTQEKSESQYREEVIGLIEDAIRIRLEPDSSPGVLLSGGTDSSTIVSLTSKILNKPVQTFSFRCKGKSFDESQYAKLVANYFNAQHNEIPYDEDRLSLLPSVVESMDEPFCDIGIEIATYVMGQAAQNRISYLFSGEGGDELFAGHPVYTADKVAPFIDAIPNAIKNPLLRILQKLPDSDQKKNLQVKIKRFAYSLSFPPELLSHRWRIYYTPQELEQLCTGDFLKNCNMDKTLDAIIKYNREADGKDPLSRSLYSDYFTLVDFYLRRLSLLRSFSIENRLPLMDHRLVEYAARIPSKLKMRGLSDTKYIYKKILEGTVPREILYDRPKLGHSVPMKNWLRENDTLRELVLDVLSDESLKKRGFFHIEPIRRMIQEHENKSHNHSHRLWGLLVLELWLRTNLD